MFKILIVEDEEKIRVELQNLLNRYGYEALTLDDFHEVDQQILRIQPHLVLLDINLPEMDGYMICRSLRQQSSIPILMVTSRWIYHLFTQDAAVIEVGMQMLLYLAPYYFTYVCIEVLSGAVRGTGDSVIPMIMTCMGVCVLRVVWIWIAVPLNPTIENVLFSYPLTWSLTSILFVLYYLQGGWLKRRLKKEERKGLQN